MKKLFSYISLALRLKKLSILRYVLYRIRIRMPFAASRWLRLSQRRLKPIFNLNALRTARRIKVDKTLVERANMLIRCEYLLFQNVKVRTTYPPRWHDEEEGQLDVFWRSDLASIEGDVKDIWDLSRFQWAQTLALAHNMTGDSKYMVVLANWICNWIENNPINKGPNWACGQECAIRLINMLNAVEVYEQNSVYLGAVEEFIKVHCFRIEATINYAISQDNNHATSEAAALYVGGAWLLCNGKTKIDSRLGRKFIKKGKRILENRVRYLVFDDGGFAMYSTHYHRVVLNTLSIVELWRRKYDLSSFSDNFYQKCKKATEWLYKITDPISGLAPNLGNNDGSNPFIVQVEDYQDFRPSVVLANMLFGNPVLCKEWKVSFDNMQLFGLSQPDCSGFKGKGASEIFCGSGLALLSTNECKSVRVFIKYPCFEYRPSQNDNLHVDFWIKGENLLRDAGTYRYKCDEPWQSYFQSAAAHNTIQFDEREQMPRIGQFLLGAWPKASKVQFSLSGDIDVQRFGCAYRDYRGTIHERHVELCTNRLRVMDKVDKFNSKAVARYRLSPLRNWSLSGNKVTDGQHTLIFSSDSPIVSIKLVDGWESRYYSRMTWLPVVEVTLNQAGSLTMEYQWA